MYDTTDEDIDNGADQSAGSQSTPLQMQIPIVELLKVCYFPIIIYYWSMSQYLQSCCFCYVCIQHKHARK